MYNINVSLNLFWMGVGHYLSSAVVEDLKDAILGFQSFSTFKRLALSVTKSHSRMRLFQKMKLLFVLLISVVSAIPRG